MATSVLEKLEEQLTCLICLNQYDNPKTLPCLHSFCLKCIQQLGVDLKDGDYYIKCPTCRKPMHVPDSGVNDLPTAFVVNSLKDIQELLKKISDKHPLPHCDNCPNKPAIVCCQGVDQLCSWFCRDCQQRQLSADHQVFNIKEIAKDCSQLVPPVVLKCSSHDEPLKVFCNACQELICHDCAFSCHKHHYDQLNLIDEAFADHQQQVEAALHLVKEKELATDNILSAVVARERAISKQRDDRISEIQYLVQHIAELIQQSVEQKVKEVEIISQMKLEFLCQQRKAAEIAMVQLKSCKEFVEHGLKFGSPQQILSMKQDMMQQMKAVCSNINPDEFQPVEEANITFTRSEVFAIDNIDVGKVQGCYDSIKEFEIKLLDLPATITTGVPVLATIAVDTKPEIVSPPLPLTCHITAQGNHATMCSIKSSKEFENQHVIQFTPSNRGRHELTVQAGACLKGGPFSFHVYPSVEVDRVNSVKEIDLSGRPNAVALSNDDQCIAVSDFDNYCVSIYTREGVRIRSFGTQGTKKGQFANRPRGVAFTRDDKHVLVTDKHRIQQLTLDGQCVMSVGSTKIGSGPLQFHNPRGIAVHPAMGQIYIGDTLNNRIQVINNDFTYSHTVGSGILGHPCNVAFDSQGNVYVANCNSNCIDVFSSEGNHLRQFTARENAAICFAQHVSPLWIAIDTRDLLYVSDMRLHSLSIFTTDGQLIKCNNCCKALHCSFGMAVDTLGDVYICEFACKLLVVL